MIRSITARRRLSLACSAACLFSAGQALAQAASSTDVSEVIVTATRRAEALQDVPIAITALSGETVKERRLSNFSDVAAAVTGVTFLQVRGPAFQNVAIRGQTSQNESPGLDLPVAIFQDDIYYGTVGSFSGDFFDIEQIAILRGPQGTTFGRNVVGGAMQITSNKPAMHDNSGQIALTVLDRPGFETQGYVNGALSEKLAGRLAFSVHDVRGYFKNLVTGNDLNDRHSWALRGSLRYQPSDSLDVQLSAFHMDEHSYGVGYRLYGQGAMVAGQNRDRRTTSLDIDGSSRRKVDAGFFKVDVETGLGVLTAITGYRGLDFSYREDGDGTPLLLNDNRNVVDEYQWSQEFRLVSPRGDRIDYLAGIYAEYGDLRREHIYNFYPNPQSQLSVLTNGAFQHQVVIGKFTVKSVAAFGEINYHITDRITLTAGGRYTYEGKEGSIDHQGVTVFYGASYYVTVKDSFKKFTPRIVVNYKPTDDILFYASASRGFKGGGWPIAATTAAAAIVPLDAESSWSYEVGAKTEWLDRRLTFNVNAYLADTKNLQVRSFINGALRDNNAGEAEVKGVEVELVARPTEALSFGGRYAYADATYKRFAGCAAGAPPLDCTGNRLPYTPKNDWSAFVQYRVPVLQGQLLLDADVRFSDAFELNPLNTQDLVKGETKVPGMLNASATYKPTNANWKVQVWAKNLTDITTVVAAFNYGVFALTPLEARSVAAGGRGFSEANRAVMNAPRSIGATLTVDF